MDKTFYYNFAYVVLLVTFQMPCLAKRSTSLATDQSSLLSLKAHITSDPHFTLARNWTNSSSVCNWIGIICSLRHHRVTALDISNMSLSGTIPPQLGNLSFLVSLNLGYNFFSGTLPQELGNLYNLQILNMQYNHLSGPIPSAILNISTLEIIALSSNELSGSLPIDMCSNLPFLEGIHLSYNHLSGKIPSSLPQCSQLQNLSLSYNSFSGQISTEIGKLKSLRALYLGGNNLNGVIPKEIGNLQNLVEFGIERNQITGTVPLNIGNLTMLRVLNLSENNLTGVLPREIGQCYKLEKLGLDFNTFTGSIPSELFNISTLRFLALSDNGLSGGLPNHLCYGLPVLEGLLLDYNYLTGVIPDSISNCSNLRILTLGSNKFTGFVPHFLGNLRLLERLHLFANNLRTESSSSELSFITSLTNCRFLKVLAIGVNPLDGIIPASIGNLSSSLHVFYAYNCKIKGSIPAVIGNLSNLVKLHLGSNELSSNIPLTVKRLRKLQGLALSNNNLEGYIPEGLCDLHSLGGVDLSRNQLSGPIPECLGNVTPLRLLYLDSNKLTSTIPSSLWRLKDLLILNLSSNSLSGFLPPEIGNLGAAIYINLSMNQLSKSIPSTIGKLQNLVNLSLAHNRIEGSIPVSVGSMISLVTLDFSYNNLSGSIPKSLEALQYLDSFNVSFNALSGEIPTGGPFRNFTVESFKANEALCGIPRFNVPLCRTVSNHRSKRKKVEFAIFIIAGVVVFVTVVSLAFIFVRYRRKDMAASRIDGVSTIPERISYYEILQATEHFNESNLLGIGSFGSVYKGILRDGKTFAVKVFNLQSEAVFRSFDVECEVLRNIRHRNLTKVISSCSNEDFKALVLEYMPKGNLEKWLHSHNYCLDVMQRLNIMIDVASALEYLHHGYSTPIVHCDLKPSNVLLDEEMIAHVSDFGIAKLLGDGESFMLTNTLATLGYIAPEYGLEGLVSTRCDVYSYGVMLMETFTRRRPIDDMFAGDLSLKSWVESSLPQSSHYHVIDAKLLNPEEEHFNQILQCVSSILELALKCSAESPGDRINMKEALAELQKIKCRFS